MNIRKYPLGQAVVYIVCQQIIDNLRAHLADFTDLSAHYTDEYCDDLQEQLEAAKNLPTEEARALMHEQLRLDMIELLKPTLKKWKFLKRYISRLYKDNEDAQIANWNAAGWNNYETAATKNWPSVEALMNDGSAYIADHSTALLANQNMPATFAAAYNAASGAMAALYTQYRAGVQNARTGTDAKIAANNTIYDSIIAVCLDGQTIFEGEITEKQFSFTAVAEIVQPNGAASAEVMVTSAENGAALSGVEFSIVGTNKHGTTNEAGDGELNQISSGNGQIKFVCDGFQDLIINHNFTAGVRAHLNVVMQPIAVVVPAEPQPEPQPDNA